jgi:hypothetical protein
LNILARFPQAGRERAIFNTTIIKERFLPAITARARRANVPPKCHQKILFIQILAPIGCSPNYMYLMAQNG